MIVDAAATTQTVSPTPSKTSLDYEAFLKLLVAQLKNQDPAKPTDSNEFMAQLASFSSVEQQVRTNDKLDALLAASRLSDSAALIGRTILPDDGSPAGVVASIELTETGPLAWLADGRSVPVAAGVRIG